MTIREIDKKAIAELSDEQLADIIYHGFEDDGVRADVAILLGTRPVNCVDRAERAAEEYLNGRFPYVIPSGGVEWDYEDGKISEAYFMRDILLSAGVPDEAIILENEATTTKENMIYGVLQLNRRLKIANVKTICIVTCAEHMRRSMALARLFLPRSVRITCAASSMPKDPLAVLKDPEKKKLIINEILLMKGLIDSDCIEDIEF